LEESGFIFHYVFRVQNMIRSRVREPQSEVSAHDDATRRDDDDASNDLISAQGSPSRRFCGSASERTPSSHAENVCDDGE
jgi:hypothetical protein